MSLTTLLPSLTTFLLIGDAITATLYKQIVDRVIKDDCISWKKNVVFFGSRYLLHATNKFMRGYIVFTKT